MIALLAKVFLRKTDDTEVVRHKYGMICGGVGDNGHIVGSDNDRSGVYSNFCAGNACPEKQIGNGESLDRLTAVSQKKSDPAIRCSIGHNGVSLKRWVL